MINRTQLVEINWNMNWGRYLVFHKSKRHLHKVSIKVINPNAHSAMVALHDGIFNAINDYNLFDNLEDVYFHAIKPIYVNPKEKIMVDIQTTQSILFNTPINLMYNAAVGSDFDKTFFNDETGSTIVRLQRHNLCVAVSAEASNFGGYVIHSQFDHVTLNEVHPRSIQFAHVTQLIRCDTFFERMNNGNLLLALADSYFGNVDDDVISITHVGKVSGIYYDQFTGSVEGNIIEVTIGGEVIEYDAAELDSTLIELLTYCIKEKMKPVETDGIQ